MPPKQVEKKEKTDLYQGVPNKLGRIDWSCFKSDNKFKSQGKLTEDKVKTKNPF